MAFWFGTLIVNLLLPFTMIGFGRYFRKGGPKEINGFFGYRTSMSMKNMDTWKFAHIYSGTVWRIAGWLMLPISLGAMFLVMGKEPGTVALFGCVLLMIQTVAITLTIIPTEKALRKNFDENGNRKNHTE